MLPACWKHWERFVWMKRRKKAEKSLFCLLLHISSFVLSLAPPHKFEYRNMHCAHSAEKHKRIIVQHPREQGIMLSFPLVHSQCFHFIWLVSYISIFILFKHTHTHMCCAALGWVFCFSIRVTFFCSHTFLLVLLTWSFVIAFCMLLLLVWVGENT